MQTCWYYIKIVSFKNKMFNVETFNLVSQSVSFRLMMLVIHAGDLDHTRPEDSRGHKREPDRKPEIHVHSHLSM